MRSRQQAGWIGVVALLTLLAAACQRSGVARVIPGVSTGDFSELSESDLALFLVCADSLGRTDASLRLDRCSPCLPLAANTSGDAALRHARVLWQRFARAPYDSLTRSASCTALAFKFARMFLPDDPELLAEATLFALASAHSAVRSRALHTLDSTLDALGNAGNNAEMRTLLERFARGVWERAQLQLARPREIPLHPFERSAHHLERGLAPFRRLPAVPAASGEYGESEARWSSALFASLAESATNVASRSQWNRLALAPLVVLGDWNAVDSTATAMLARSPRDSAVMPVRALAAYRRVRRPVLEYPAVQVLFDSALAAMPRGDSARIDSFDGVLSKDDDEWRYGFLPTDRALLDERGWAVLDPLWSTPVNELRLERLARIADADVRYADRSVTGQAGHETFAGRLQLRRGVVEPRWVTTRSMVGFRRLDRGWPNLRYQITLVDSPSLWQVFSHDRFLDERLALAPVVRDTGLCTGDAFGGVSFVACAESQRAAFFGVPFYATTDTIDVTAARFRSGTRRDGTDSVDIYLGARLPLRRFTALDRSSAAASERIVLSAWLATPLGQPLWQRSDPRALPKASERAWTAQWTARAARGAVMHRVEALDAVNAIGARGASLLTADQMVEFPLRGFGMSDVLVAASASPRSAVLRRWTDLTLAPNGAAVPFRAPFALVWEVYDLEPGPDGRVRWSVEIRRERGIADRRDNAQDLLANSRRAGTRVLASEADAPAVAYTRDAAAAPTIADRLTFNLGDAGPGRHVVQVTIRDLVSGKSVNRGVSLRVLVP